MASSGEEPPLKLLALDGGGIRGLSELLLIRGVMQRLMVDLSLDSLPRPCDYFDLIGGTSTGGIIAIMLGRLRMDVDTAIEHYVNLTKHVFSDTKPWGDKTRIMEEAIKTVVNHVTSDPESPLLDSNEAGIYRTFVCAMNAHNMNAKIPTLFRTYQSRETHLNCKIWEAARATSAAPTFFKPIEIGRKQPYVDGGLGCNNPSRLVLDEAKRIFGSRQIGLLLSIGTGMARVINIEEPGAFQRIVPTDVIDALRAIANDCEDTHESMVDLFENLPYTYFRLNVDQGMQDIKFSEWEKLSNVEAHTTQYMNKKEVNAKLDNLVNEIRAPRGQLTIEQLVSPRPPVERSSIQRVRKLCPLPLTSFTGRSGILEKIHKYFGSPDGKTQRVFVLHGLGGSGKSQLAFKFLEESQANKRFSNVFYVDATNKQTLEMDLEGIGGVERSVEASLRWLADQSDGQWMLLFDNADDVKLDLSAFFPACASGNILITSRNRELRLYTAEDSDQKVTGMEHDDATNLLLLLARAEKTNENQELAEQIVQELHHFALAVSQAGAFIRCHSSLSHYRQLYQRERDKLLQHEGVQGRDRNKLAVYATWSLSYEKLDTSGRTFLQICSMLHHEGISEEIFEKAALSELQLDDPELQNEVTRLLNLLGKRESNWSSWDFLQVVKQLGSYSLIEYDHRNCTYGVHPLVQYWSGTTMDENNHVMKKIVASIIGLSISWTFTKEDYKYRRALLKHVTSCTTSLNLTEIDPRVAVRLALAYSEQGRWNDAEALLVVVMEKRKLLLGDEHPETLKSMANLATTYICQGRWNDAEALQVVVMEKIKLLLGDEHLDTFRSMGILATTYSSQGRWNDAEALEVVVMEKIKLMLGDEHPDTLTSIGNLATTCSSQGRWKDAEALLVVVMEKMKLLLGDEHLNTLKIMASLAITYSRQGRWKDAEALEVVVMEKRKLLLGDEHPDTLTSMASLATTYGLQGHWNDAEALEVVVMEKRKLLLGDEHLDTLTSMGNLATTYGRQGRWKDAEALEVVVMEKGKLLLGDEHPDTLTSMGNLATTYGRQGRWKDAEALLVVVMERMKLLLGDEHLDTLTSMGNLATIYGSQGRWNDAEALLVVVMERMKLLLGDEHPDTLTIMASLATTYGLQGHWNDAEALEVVVMEKRKLLLGDEHPDTLTSMASLATTYICQGRWNDAEALLVVVMERMKLLLGDEHPDTLTIMANLAITYSHQGCWNEVEALLLVVLEKWKGDHPSTLSSMAYFASKHLIKAAGMMRRGFRWW